MTIIRPRPQELDAIKPFSELLEPERSALAKRLTLYKAKAGRYILRQGSASDEMYFLARGSVKICCADNSGKEAILAILRPGEVIGEITLLCGGTRSADAVALTTCTLYVCTKESFNAHLAEHSGLAHMLLKNLALRVRAASARISDLALYDVTCRVARVLCEISISSEIEEESVQIINDPPTHQDLASMIGASREAVTRALHELERKKHIVVEDERIIVRSLPG